MQSRAWPDRELLAFQRQPEIAFAGYPGHRLPIRSGMQIQKRKTGRLCRLPDLEQC